MSEYALRSFRINAREEKIPLVAAFLSEEGYRFEPEPFSPFCFRLLFEPRPLGSSLAAQFGYIYIQDRSSMLPPLALSPSPGEHVLDMCASPGSKTSFLAQIMKGEGIILANEPNPSRLSTLRANLERLDIVNVLTSSYEGQKLPLESRSWHAIQLDPPCSGWGTCKKNPSVLTIWQGEKIEALLQLQRQLLRKAADLLAPGGRILYSTCTTNPKENEDQILFAQEELGLQSIPLSPFDGFVFDKPKNAEKCLLVNGERSNAQGFFLALLGKKADGLPPDQSVPQPSALLPFKTFEINRALSLSPGILPAGRAIIVEKNVYFIPEGTEACLGGAIRFKGALLGTLHGLRFQPSPRRRCLGDATSSADALVLDSTSDILSLLAGRSFQTGLVKKEALLFWRTLPLGFIRLKNGRAIASFR